MRSFIQILPEVAVVFAIVAAIVSLGLAFRNPFRPKWLHRESMSVAASLAIAAAVCFGTGYMISGSIAAGLDVATAVVLTVIVFAVAGFAIVRGFHIGERLRRSDAGQSPFYPLAGPDAPRHASQRQFGTGAGA